MDVENFGWSVVKNFAEHRFSEVGLVSGAINFVESKLPHEKINVAEIAKSFASQLKDLAQEKIANQTEKINAKIEQKKQSIMMKILIPIIGLFVIAGIIAFVILK